jgi:hypothetical protein
MVGFLKWTKGALVAVAISGATEALTADVSPVSWSAATCRLFCSTVIHYGEQIQSYLELRKAARDGRARLQYAPSVPDSNTKSCARLPDGATKCCSSSAQVVIEYVVGQDPFEAPGRHWFARCHASE